MNLAALTCMKCFAEDGKPSDIFHTIPLNDEGFYELVCEKGHETIILLQEQNCEILFEIGAHALLDGYPDAAVTRFAVALERFYEVYTKIILLNQGVTLDEFLTIWQNISNRSERQYGAFFVAYQLDQSNHRNKYLPKLIEKNWVEFRNDVIHKGRIPSEEKARDYGRRIFNFTRELLIHTTEHYSKEMHQVINEHVGNISKASEKKNVPISTICIPTLLTLTRCTPMDFDDALAELPRYSKFSIRK